MTPEQKGLMRREKDSIGINGLKRFAGILRVLVGNGFGMFAEALVNRPTEAEKVSGERPSIVVPSPVRLRRILTELGPSFIKLGQLMSVRADLFPPQYIEELQKLQDQVPPQPFKVIKPFIEKQLGRPLSSAFEEFNETALASASIAQVYKAKLNTGEQVAVKVVRPGIVRQIRSDIRVMYYMAAQAGKEALNWPG